MPDGSSYVNQSRVVLRNAPRGPIGPSGPSGPSGATGPGITGPSGASGPTGPSSVNPDDVGYDIIPILGQSNALGRGTGIDTDYIDVPDSRVYQLGNLSSPYSGVLVQAKEPLFHQELPVATVGFGLTFGKLYAAGTNSNRKVLLVPCARGNTGFASTGTYTWRVGATGATTNLYDAAILQINKALALPGANRVTCILWHQGEANTGSSAGTYTTDLDNVINDLRTRYGATVPFVLGGMSPARIATNTGYAAIDTVHKATKDRKPYIGFWNATPLYNVGDTVHFSGAGQRINGYQAYAAYRLATTVAGGNVAAPIVVIPPEPTTPGFNDQFNRDDDTVLGVTPQGKTWNTWASGSSAVWVIESNKARYASGSAAAYAFVEGDTVSNNGVLTGTISAIGVAVGGLIGHYVDNSNHIVVELRQVAGTNRLQLFKRVAATKTLLGTSAADKLSAAGSAVGLSITGTAVSVILDGVTVIGPVTVSDIPSGTKWGLYSSTSDTVLSWDSLVLV